MDATSAVREALTPLMGRPARTCAESDQPPLPVPWSREPDMAPAGLQGRLKSDVSLFPRTTRPVMAPASRPQRARSCEDGF